MNSNRCSHSAQDPFAPCVYALAIVSDVLLVTSVWPLCCGWCNDDMAGRVFRYFVTAFQKSDNYPGSLSDTMLVGKLNLAAICFLNSNTEPSASSPVVVGINCACLVSRSTTTKIELNSSDQGKFTMKSIEMESYGCAGIGFGINSPNLLKLEGLVFCHTLQEWQNCKTSAFILGQ